MSSTNVVHRQRQSHRAYTLIELLIVVAILGLAGAMLVPHLTGRGSMEAQTAVRMIIGDISFAQADALAHQEYRRVHFYADGSGYCITRVEADEIGDDWDPDTADYVIDPFAPGGAAVAYVRDFNLDSEFALVEISEVAIDGDGLDLYFDELGGTVMSGNDPGIGGTITVVGEDETYEITITPFTGKLTVALVEDEG